MELDESLARLKKSAGELFGEDVTEQEEQEFTEILYDLLEEHLSFVCAAGDWYLQDDIPKKKLRGARESYVHYAEEETIIGLVDFTVLGSAKEGMIFTTEGIYYKEMFGTARHVAYADIRKIEIIERGKKECDDLLLIYSNPEGTWDDKLETLFINKQSFAELIKEIVEAYPKEKALIGEMPIVIED